MWAVGVNNPNLGEDHVAAGQASQLNHRGETSPPQALFSISVQRSKSWDVLPALGAICASLWKGTIIQMTEFFVRVAEIAHELGERQIARPPISGSQLRNGSEAMNPRQTPLTMGLVAIAWHALFSRLIAVSGPTESGKSTAAFLIEKALREAGMTVTVRTDASNLDAYRGTLEARKSILKGQA